MTNFGPIPNYGEHMPLQEFLECIESGGFIDYDGTGYWATATEMSGILVLPSTVHLNRPDWATHVVWFNK